MFTTVGSMVTVSPGVRDVRCPDTNKISGTYLFSLTVDVAQTEAAMNLIEKREIYI